MAPTMNSTIEVSTRSRPIVLVVDDEPALLELVHDVVGHTQDYKLISASSVEEARQIIEDQLAIAPRQAGIACFGLAD